jgi:hypothetical protein
MAWSEFDRGGHFAALEAPDLLVGDVRRFFGALSRPVHVRRSATYETLSL